MFSVSFKLHFPTWLVIKLHHWKILWLGWAEESGRESISLKKQSRAPCHQSVAGRLLLIQPFLPHKHYSIVHLSHSAELKVCTLTHFRLSSGPEDFRKTLPVAPKRVAFQTLNPFSFSFIPGKAKNPATFPTALLRSTFYVCWLTSSFSMGFSCLGNCMKSSRAARTSDFLWHSWRLQ